MNEIVLLVSAEADLLRGYERYNDIQEEHGEEFIRRADVALSMLVHHPLIGSRYVLNFRKVFIQKFPYGIFYVPESKRVVVHAVLDLRMDPSHIKRRLSGQ
jgi:toxin ParE1/3/4